jgi:hypothetical protein
MPRTATDIDEVLAIFDEILERARREGDRRGWFAALYRKVTAEVQRGMAAGLFDDAERMERLDVLFAQRYFDALGAFDARATPTDAWRVSFEAATSWRPVIVQHLLLGMNAHINLDLGIAAARCSPGPALEDLRVDFDRINAILFALFDELFEALGQASPWMGLLDRVGGRTDQQLLRFSIAAARRAAWRFAQRLAALPEGSWDAVVAERDRITAGLARRVLGPGPLPTAALLVVRVRERRSVAEVLDLLARQPLPGPAEVERRAEALRRTVPLPG